MNAAFSKETGIKVVASYAASSALMKQIEQGAPADVFASADLDWMDYGSRKSSSRDTRVNLLGNRLVLIAPKNRRSATVTIAPGFDLAKLAGDGRIATGDVRRCRSANTPRRRWRSSASGRRPRRKIAMAENVRAALTLCARRGAARHRL